MPARLAREQLLRLVIQGAGRSGPNVDYVLNTEAHLRENGIRDPDSRMAGGSASAGLSEIGDQRVALGARCRKQMKVKLDFARHGNFFRRLGEGESGKQPVSPMKHDLAARHPASRATIIATACS